MFRFRKIRDWEMEGPALHPLEETIRRNTRVFEILLARSHEGVLLLTADMALLQAVHPILERPASELIGLSIRSFIHPDDQASLDEAFSRLVSGQKQSDVCECRALDSDGSWRWLDISMTDLLGNPDVAAVLFNYRDITQLKQHEEMAQSLAAYLACPEYAMSTQDQQGEILDWNSGAELAFGYPAAEIVGKNISVLLPATSLDQEIAARAAVIGGQVVPEYTAICLRRDGHEVSMRVKLSAIPGRQKPAVARISRLTTP